MIALPFALSVALAPPGSPAARAGAYPTTLSRRAVTTAAAAAFGLSASSAPPAWAGYVTSLGIETTKPQDAERDDDLLGSKAVQASIESLKGYKEAALALQAKFDAERNMPLIAVIRKEFDFSKVRDSLNIATAVFDEQTQLTTDRIARSIIYDLTELEGAARLKKGETERTDKKVANVNKWFVKLDTDLATLLSYFA